MRSRSWSRPPPPRATGTGAAAKPDSRISVTASTGNRRALSQAAARSAKRAAVTLGEGERRRTGSGDGQQGPGHRSIIAQHGEPGQVVYPQPEGLGRKARTPDWVAVLTVPAQAYRLALPGSSGPGRSVNEEQANMALFGLSRRQRAAACAVTSMLAGASVLALGAASAGAGTIGVCSGSTIYSLDIELSQVGEYGEVHVVDLTSALSPGATRSTRSRSMATSAAPRTASASRTTSSSSMPMATSSVAPARPPSCLTMWTLSSGQPVSP